MKTLAQCIVLLTVSLFCLCSVIVDPTGPTSSSPTTEKKTDQPTTSTQKFSQTITGFFPFQNNSNAWWYTEASGNTVRILVTDTISDNGITYFRVSFRENRVDTTDDWFKMSSSGIYFGQSLIGNFDLFLPTKIDSVKGSFMSGNAKATYTYYDSLSVNNTTFHRVVCLKYTSPLIHGFDQITVADSVGIIELVDHTSRWAVSYEIDSCNIDDKKTVF